MRESSFIHRRGFNLIAVSLVLCSSSAFADRPNREHGNPRHQSQHQDHRRDDHQDYNPQSRGSQEQEHDFRSAPYFNDQHRYVIKDYYAQQSRGGHCPPGLKKKHNGCLPPGQAKKWRLGRPLPRNVVYYEVPSSLIGPAPAGYRFVRVASDILMIAIGTGMVMDAITDLNGM